ncbi:MAG: carbon-nitrogen hydrolase family protein [Phycisphaerales bacterium]|nr:carbon-nitrogen hydrolase family protein [Phycisphaerales bacterium]
MSRPVRLAMVHVHNKLESMSDRRKDLLRLVDQAGQQGANIVVLPERADHHRTHEGIKAVEAGKQTIRKVLGLTAKSPWMIALAALAKQYRMLVIPSIVEVDGQKTWASSPVIGPDGTWLGKYDKTHLAPGEKCSLDPGQHLEPIATPFCKLGIFICYDIHFPEITRVYELKNADILLWQTMRHDRFERDFFTVALPARAMMHGLPLGVATYAVDDQLWKRSTWNSVIYDAFGQQVAGGIAPANSLVQATIDLDLRPQLPLEFDKSERLDLSGYLRHQRRPELYEILLKKPEARSQ